MFQGEERGGAPQQSHHHRISHTRQADIMSEGGPPRNEDGEDWAQDLEESEEEDAFSTVDDSVVWGDEEDEGENEAEEEILVPDEEENEAEEEEEEENSVPDEEEGEEPDNEEGMEVDDTEDLEGEHEAFETVYADAPAMREVLLKIAEVEKLTDKEKIASAMNRYIWTPSQKTT